MIVFDNRQGLHLVVVPESESDVCVICHHDAGEYGCQRCGVRFHAECYLERVASPREKSGPDEPTPVIAWLCPGCRS